MSGIVKDRMICSRDFKIKIRKLAADKNCNLTQITHNLSKKNIGDLLEDDRKPKKTFIPFEY